MSETQKFKGKTYLIVTLDKRPQFPQVVWAAIHSESASSLSMAPRNTMYAEILVVEWDSFQEAKEMIECLVMETESFAWLRRWIDPSEEAHMARRHLRQEAEHRVQAILKLQEDEAELRILLATSRSAADKLKTRNTVAPR